MKKESVFILYLVFIFSVSVFGQNQKIDSLNAVLKPNTEDTLKVKILHELCREYYMVDSMDKAQDCLQEALAICQKINYRRGLIMSYNLFAKGSHINNNYPKALEFYLKALKIAEQAGDKSNIAASYQRIGNLYYLENNTKKSLDYFQRALNLYKELNDKKCIAVIYHNLAYVASLQGNSKLVKENFMKAIELSVLINDKVYLGILYEQFGNFFIGEKDYEKALYYHTKSMEMSRSLKDYKGIADSYSDIGNIYLAQNNYRQALTNQLAALDLYLKYADNHTIAESYMIVGQLYMDLKDYPKAIDYHLLALNLAEGFTDKEESSLNIYFSLSDVYAAKADYTNAYLYLYKSMRASEKLSDEKNLKKAYHKLSELAFKEQDYKKAYEFQKLFSNLNDSLYDAKEQEYLEAQHLQEQFEAEKKDNEKQLHVAQISQKELELKQATTLRYALICGLIFILVFAGFMYNRFKVMQKQKRIITVQKELVEQKNKETEIQKKVIEEKQIEIIESISYAKRLQEAILPSQEFINKNLEHNFILYQPKDIVAGDFYWAEGIMLRNSQGENFNNAQPGRPFDLFYIAAADSTGHGVPGAMVSVVCSNALNRALKEFKETETGKILDKTRELVLETFEKSETDVKDGMDISLLCIDLLNRQVFWSGANNPLWYIQHGELHEIKPDKQPIGKTDNPAAFKTHRISDIDETTFYLFTDGYADQFGGPKGKKFKYRQFAELLTACCSAPLNQQQNVISNAFMSWKGDLEQVDDVCVIGIKV